MANIPQYSKFTITSMPDPSSGFAIPDYEKDLRAIVNQAIKSALPPDVYFKATPKEINKSTGEMKVDVYVHREDAGVVQSSLNTESERLAFRGGVEKYNITTQANLSKEENRALWKDELARGKTDTEGSRFNRGTFLKIVAILTAILNITRRILSSVLTFSQQSMQDMITAHNLGMSYEAVRGYRHTETAHGMKEGTITGAISDIQAKFGNITMLDEKALETLAVVMGGKIEEMATMGLGASNPEKVLGAILDTFNEKANAGYNSVGQYVGEQQARRELYSYLLKVSPQIADIFATMQEEQHNINSLFRGQADTFENWKNAMPTSRGEHTPAEYNVTQTTGQQWNVVKDILAQIKEGIFVSLAPDIMILLRRLANIRWGMSEAESQEMDDRNREANQEFIDSAKKQLSLLGNTEADKQRKLALEYYIKQVEKENTKKEHVGNLVPTPDEIVVKGQKLRASGIKDTVYAGEFGYSTAVKDIVDRYTPSQELEDYRKQYERDLSRDKESRVKDKTKALEKQKQEQTNREYSEAIDKINKEHEQELSKHKGRFAGSSGAQAVATIQAKYMYADRSDLWYDKNGKELPLYKQMDNAIKAGLVKSSGGITPSYSVTVPDYMKHAVTEQEIADIRKSVDNDTVWSEEGFYMGAYRYFNENYMFDKHLAGMLVEEAKKRAEEGTTLYDLDVLQRVFGADLSKMSEKFEKTYTGSGAILSYASDDNGVIVHKIVFDLNNNGVAEASDVPLYSYTTNRISDTGTVISEVNISNGKVSSVGTSASKQKMQSSKTRDRL